MASFLNTPFLALSALRPTNKIISQQQEAIRISSTRQIVPLHCRLVLKTTRLYGKEGWITEVTALLEHRTEEDERQMVRKYVYNSLKIFKPYYSCVLPVHIYFTKQFHYGLTRRQNKVTLKNSTVQNLAVLLFAVESAIWFEEDERKEYEIPRMITLPPVT